MPSSKRARLFPELANQQWTLWAKHEKGPKAWLPILTGLRHSVAISEMVTRQDRVRRSEQPCVFKLLPDGEVPTKSGN